MADGSAVYLYVITGLPVAVIMVSPYTCPLPVLAVAIIPGSTQIPENNTAIFLYFIIYSSSYTGDYFNSSTTTEKGGSLTVSVLPFNFAPLNAAGFILPGSSNVLRSCSLP